MLPVEDTKLYVRDTGGTGRPVVCLNGVYADQRHWKRVIAGLGPGYSHITYDAVADAASLRDRQHHPVRPGQ